MNYLLVLSAAALGSTVATVALSMRNNARYRSKSWADLVGELKPINADRIEELVHDYLHPGNNQIEIEPFDMWLMIGGVEGLDNMRHNADIICALAAFAVHWNYDEAVIVTERIRREALTVKKAIAKATRYGTANPVKLLEAPFAVFEAAAAYHLMRARVLALYKGSHAGLYPQLVAAL